MNETANVTEVTMVINRDDIYHLLRGIGTGHWHPTQVIQLSSRAIYPVIDGSRRAFEWDFTILDTLTLDELIQLYFKRAR